MGLASLVLRVGSARYRVPGSPGCQVAPAPSCAPVPGAPPWLCGVGIYKGEALPLVHLASALDPVTTADPGSCARMLVTRDAGTPVAFLLDDVDGDAGGGDAAALDLRALARDLLGRAAREGATP